MLARHGAFTLGSTMKEALDNAEYLESECKAKFEERVKDFRVPENMKAWLSCSKFKKK